MPLIIDPSAGNAPPLVSITSPDGILTAVSIPASGGVYLEADFSGWATRPTFVRFVRGADTIVASGNSAVAVAGQAIAYDDHAPLGVASVWRAIGLDVDGATLGESAQAALMVPAPAAPLDLWIKSVFDPDLNLRVMVSEAGERAFEGRLALSSVQGSPFPSGSYDVLSAGTWPISFLTGPETSQSRVLDLLRSGVLLVQTTVDYDLPDMFCLPASASVALLGAPGSGNRLWTLSLTEVDRPSVSGFPLVIPGRSYGAVVDGFTSYDAAASALPTYADWTTP